MFERRPHRTRDGEGSRRGVPRRRLIVAVLAAVLLSAVSGLAVASVPPTTPEPTAPATTPPPPTTSPPEPTSPPTTTPPTTAPATTAPDSATTTTTVEPAPEVDLDLVPLCTSAEDLASGTRTFRVDNNSGTPVEITLQNADTGESESGTAPPGPSTWNVPAGGGANATEVVVDGQTVASAASTNLVCAALDGNAQCDPANGQTTVTWTVSNNADSSASITGDARGVTFVPDSVAPYGTAFGTEAIVGPTTDQELSETVTVQLGDGRVSELDASVIAAACEGPPPQPPVTFTFTTTASTSTAVVGDTVEYTYCGQNTSEIPLEVVRLVDDRLGVVIELPSVETVVAPGDSLCNTDVGQPVSYTVTRDDENTTIVNDAVVTIRTQEPTPREFQAVASTEVAVPLRGRIVSLLVGEDGRSWVCHRTPAHYNLQEVSTSSLGEGSGHNDDGHQDGLDIVPPGPWDPDGRNWNIDNEVIWLRGCVDVVTTTVNPIVTQATCSGGVVTTPTVVTPAAQPGVRYTVAPAGPYDGTKSTTVTVTATLVFGFIWGQMPVGWTKINASTATFTVTLHPASCQAVTPVDPTVIQPSCVGGVFEPSLELPTTDGITYSAAPEGPYVPGQSVTVTATLTASGAAWPATLPAGWTRASDTTARFVVKFVALACTRVVPVAPTVKPATCVNGVVTNATVTVATTPTGVTYVALPPAPYVGTDNHTVNVRAVLIAGYVWGQMPPGWEQLSTTTAIFVVTLTAGSCQVVTPVVPTLVQAVCVGGVVTRPTLTLPVTTGITYSAAPAGPYSQGQSVTVTATLTAGGAWPATFPAGWTRASDTTATFVVTFAAKACTPVVPVDPVVVLATCVNGAVRPPTVALVQTAGIVYSMAPSNLGDGTTTVEVTVTAKVEDDFGWGSVTARWIKVNASTATWTVTLPAVSCTRLAPVAPTVAEAICRGGVVEPPTLLLSRTDGITYTTDDADGVYAPGQSVTVTATLAAAGVAWPAEMPLGWTRTSPTVATYSVTFAAKSCVPVTPTAPGVVQATCTAGAVRPPTVTLPTTAGIVYSIAPANLGNGSADVVVTVTATVTDGSGWGQLPSGWTMVNVSTATWKVTLLKSSCTQVTPVVPTVKQAVCVGGVVTRPTLTLPATTGITYSAAPAGPYSQGQSVVVTARLDEAGVGWPDDLAVLGWSEVDDTTATLTVRFDPVACTPVTPTAPGVVQATCTAGAVRPPTVTLPTTAGIVYSIAPANLGNGSADVVVTVTATVTDGSGWGQLPSGWTMVNASTATWKVTLLKSSCTQVTPVVPTVKQAVCVGGVVTRPTLTLPATTGITYSAAPAGPYSQGQSVVVTARLDEAGVGWPDDLAVLGWSEVDDTTATLTVRFDPVACTPVTPTAPGVVQATCTAGAVRPPTVTLPTTAGIVYSIAPANLGNGSADVVVTVTATVTDGSGWGQLPSGWTMVNASTATWKVTLLKSSCTQVTPVVPTVKQAVCVGGVVTRPTLTLPATTGITYSAAPAGPYSQGHSVVVTARLDEAGVGWPDDLAVLGWSEVDDTTATLTVRFDPVACTPVTPTAPGVVQATCANGAVTAPTIELGTTAGIVYEVDPSGPYDGTKDATVTVTATVVDRFAWGQMPDGWVQAGPSRATFTVELKGTSCEEVTPVGPTVTQAVCAGGVVTRPQLLLQTTDGIIYSADPEGPYAAGDTVAVTATLDPAGVGWPTELPDGWEETSDTEATLSVTFDAVECTPVTPVAPEVTAASCVNGTAVAPSIVFAGTPGLIYSAEPSGPFDPTVATDVLVTATVIDGFAWEVAPAAGFAPPGAAASQPVELPEGWTLVSPTEATFALTVPRSPDCRQIDPVAPQVAQPECAAGTASEPAIESVPVDGVVYHFEPEGPWAPGDKVMVTATITDPAAGWAQRLGRGWTQVDSTTARYDVTFAEVDCTTEPPPTTSTVPTSTTAPSTGSTPPTTAPPAGSSTTAPATGSTPPTTAPTAGSPTSTTAPTSAGSTSTAPPVGPTPTSAPGELARTGAEAVRLQVVLVLLVLALGSLLIVIGRRRSSG